MSIARTVYQALGGEPASSRANSFNVPGPGHSKADRSLSVTDDPANPDGFVVFSHAGDDPIACRDYVRRAAGLPAFEPMRGERPVDPEYVYRDQNGAPYLRVTKVYRDGKKSFYQHAWNGSAWVSGAKQVRIPYRLPELLAADTIYVVEGEKDADRLAGLGLVATTAPEGAGKWRDELGQWFKGKHVVVLADNDEPGRKHAAAIEEGLRGISASCRQVHFPELPDKGDVSDYLDLGHNKDDLLAHVAGFGRKPDPKRPSGFTAAMLRGMEFEPVKYVVPGYVAEGLTILAGRPKLGKSWFTLDIAIAVAMGGTCLGGIACDQGEVLVMALEDNQRRLQSRMKKLMPPLLKQPWPDDLHFATAWPRANEGGLRYLEDWLDDHPRARMVIVDVLAMWRPIRKGNDTGYDSDYGPVKQLQELAQRRGVAVVLVHHTRKGGSESGDPFETVSGTLGLSGAADTVLVLDRNSQGCTLYGRGRDIEEIESAVTFDKLSCRWLVQGDVMEVRRSSQRDHILKALLEAGEPVSPAVIADVIGARRDAVRQLLITMVKAGDVMKSTRGMYVHPEIGCDSGENATTHHNDHNDHNAYEGEVIESCDESDCDDCDRCDGTPYSEVNHNGYDGMVVDADCVQDADLPPQIGLVSVAHEATDIGVGETDPGTPSFPHGPADDDDLDLADLFRPIRKRDWEQD